MEQPFKWVADYGDSKLLEFENGKETSFYDIDKYRLLSFYLTDNTEIHGFNLSDGTFYSGEFKRITFSLWDKDKDLEFPINTNLVDYSDIIQYKTAYTDFSSTGHHSGNIITDFNIGYKTNIKYPNFELKFQSILTIKPTAVPGRFLSIYLLSNRDPGMKLCFNIQIDQKVFIMGPFRLENDPISGNPKGRKIMIPVNPEVLLKLIEVAGPETLKVELG